MLFFAIRQQRKVGSGAQVVSSAAAFACGVTVTNLRLLCFVILLFSGIGVPTTLRSLHYVDYILLIMR